MQKFKAIVSLSLNAIAVISSLIGLFLVRDLGPIAYAKYFTLITNCTIVVVGLISVGTPSG